MIEQQIHDLILTAVGVCAAVAVGITIFILARRAADAV